MKLWFVEIGEPLPLDRNARLFRYGLFTKLLVNNFHHDVTWWTSGFSHFGRKHLYTEDAEVVIDGVKLKIIKGLGYQNSISIKRILHQRDFAEKFFEKSSQCSKPDLIICPIPTIENAYCAVQKGFQLNIPVLIDIRDEWPDELVDAVPSLLRPLAKLFLRGAFKKMQYICKNATGIIGVSKNFQEYALKFAGRDKVPADGIFPHGYPEMTDPGINEEDRLWWSKIGVDDKKMICCFFGTIGNFFDLDTVIETAGKFNKNDKIQFVLCGNGRKLDYYKKKAMHLRNVIFPGFVDGNKISALMTMADVGLAPYARGTRMALPNKVFEYMAGGLPLVSSIKGEIVYMLEKYECGFTYDADSTEQLTSVIQKLYDHPILRKQMGKNGQKLFSERFTTEKIVMKLNEHIKKVVEEFHRS